MKEATQSALKAVNGKVTQTQIEDEDDKAVYRIEITDQNGKSDVKVDDAKTCKVL